MTRAIQLDHCQDQMQISDIIVADKIRGAFNWQVLNKSIALAPVSHVCRPPHDFANENENIEYEEND